MSETNALNLDVDRFNQAIQYYSENKMKLSIEVLNQIEGDIEGRNNILLSKCYLSLNEIETSLKYISKYIHRYNYSPTGWYLLAKIISELKQIPQDQYDAIVQYTSFFLTLNKIEYSYIEPFFPRLFKTEMTPEFFNILSSYNKDELNFIDSTFKVPSLLLLGLSKIYIMDVFLEDLFTHVRKKILFGKYAGDHTNFLSCLGMQCFINEYIFDVSDNEEMFVKILLDRLEAKEEFNGRKDAIDVALLSCYYPLYKLKNCEKILTISRGREDNLINDPFSLLLIMQVKEPLRELELKQKYNMIFNDTVTSEVKDQYEENPYPRWISTGNFNNKDNLKNRVYTSFGRPLTLPEDKYNVLIAGCGTGKHSILSSMYLEGSDIYAIDISASSLAYAERKTEEYGLTNIKYSQRSILDLNEETFGFKFDHVESFGVIHHMEDPIEAWRKLIGVTKKGGTMRVSLYSRLIREKIDIVKNIAGLESYTNINDIKKARDKLINIDETINNVSLCSTSVFRDTFLHYHERRYNLLEIEKIVSSLNLEFIGIQCPNDLTLSLFNQKYSKESMNDFKRWNEFELDNDSTFQRTYDMWFVNKN